MPGRGTDPCPAHCHSLNFSFYRIGQNMMSFTNFRRRRRNAALLLCVCFAITALMSGASQAQQQEPHAKQPTASERGLPDKGPLLIHGNYCGPGNRKGAPVDALDAACMRHDACMPSTGLPSCGCMARLQHEAEAVARNPSEPADVQILATATAAGAALVLCEGSR